MNFTQKDKIILLRISVNIFCMRLLSNNNLIVTKWN